MLCIIDILKNKICFVVVVFFLNDVIPFICVKSTQEQILYGLIDKNYPGSHLITKVLARKTDHVVVYFHIMIICSNS